MKIEKRLIKTAVRMFGCDDARISRPLRKWFLILMWKRSTRDTGGWYVSRPGSDMKRIDFDYFEEQCVASGNTSRELLKSMREYKLLGGGAR